LREDSQLITSFTVQSSTIVVFHAGGVCFDDVCGFLFVVAMTPSPNISIAKEKAKKRLENIEKKTEYIL
jgi:hypothetical protein